MLAERGAARDRWFVDAVYDRTEATIEAVVVSLYGSARDLYCFMDAYLEWMAEQRHAPVLRLAGQFMERLFRTLMFQWPEVYGHMGSILRLTKYRFASEIARSGRTKRLRREMR